MIEPATMATIVLMAIAPLTGSLLGTVVLRVPMGQSVVMPRSACDHCGHVLGLWDLLPLISWLATRGRCRYCGGGVSGFYPLIELAALGVVVWAWTAVMPGWQLWAASVLGWWLMALALVNLRHAVLPDGLTLPLVPLGLAVAWFAAGPGGLAGHALGALAGFAAGALVAALGRKLGGGVAPRMGEAKLLAAAGAWVSWAGLAGVVAIAASGALVTALAAAARGRRLFADGGFAAGAWACLGTWLVWLYGPWIFG